MPGRAHDSDVQVEAATRRAAQQTEQADLDPAVVSSILTPESVLSLQRSAGNLATTALLERSGASAPGNALPVFRQPDHDAPPGPSNTPSPAGPTPVPYPNSDGGAPTEGGSVSEGTTGPTTGPPGDAGPAPQPPPAPTPAGGATGQGPAPAGPETDQAAPTTDSSPEVDQSEPVGGDTLTEELCVCEPNPEYEALLEEWGAPGSPERQAKIDDAYESANALENLGMGLASGSGVALVSTLAESGLARYFAAKGVSQAAKAAGPAGAVVGGIIGVYSLYNRGWVGTGAALSLHGWNEGTGDERLANRWNAVAELLDLLGAVADVLAGFAGIVALAATAIGLIPGMQWVLPAVPIAAKVAFWGGIVGMACGILKGIAQQVSREYRESHLLNMQLTNSADMLHQQEQVTAQAEAGYQFLGGIAGTAAVAGGSKLAERRTAGHGPDGAPSEGALTTNEQLALNVRQKADATRNQQLRDVDDAVTGGVPATDAVSEARADTDGARTGVRDAETARTSAQQSHDGAVAREAETRRLAEQADADAARADAEVASAQSRADEAAARRDTSNRERAEHAGAEAALADTRARTKAAADELGARTEALDGARSRQTAAASEVRRLEGEVRSHRQGEADALAAAENVEFGQMQLALSEWHAQQAARAEAQLTTARADLETANTAVSQERGRVDAARLELEVARAGQQAMEDHMAGRAAPPTDDAHAGAVEADTSARAEVRAKENAAAGRRDQARQANEEHAAAAGERQRRESALDARTRSEAEAMRGLREATERELRSARDEAPATAAETAGDVMEIPASGGTAQDVLGGDYELSVRGEQRIVAPCLNEPPPTTSAQIERDEADARAHRTIAADAQAQATDADADADARSQDSQNLGKLQGSMMDRKREVTDTEKGLGEREKTHTKNEQVKQRRDAKVDQASGKLGDMNSFASFVARILGYAGGLTSSLLPDSVQEAGRGIAAKGEQVSSATAGTQEGIEQQQQQRGAEQAKMSGERGATEASKAQMPRTKADVDAGQEQVDKMREAADERRAAASGAADQNRQIESQASSEADNLESRADGDRAALNDWASECRDARQDWVEETTTQYEDMGYEVEVEGL